MITGARGLRTVTQSSCIHEKLRHAPQRNSTDGPGHCHTGSHACETYSKNTTAYYPPIGYGTQYTDSPESALDFRFS